MLASPALRPFRRRYPPPFTAAWLAATASPPPRRHPLVLPAWLPGEQRLSALFVLLLVAGVALVG